MRRDKMSGGDYRRFIQTLEAKIKEQGFTQAKLAAALGYSQSWFSKVKRGGRNLDVADLLKIASVLRIGPQELLPGAAAAPAATEIDIALKERLYSSLPRDIVDYIVRRAEEKGEDFG